MKCRPPLSPLRIVIILLSFMSVSGRTGARIVGPLRQIVETLDTSEPEQAWERCSARGISPRRREGRRLLAVICRPRDGIDPGNVDRVRISETGGFVDAVSESWMRVLLPLDGLQSLSEHPDLATIRLPAPIACEGGFGTVISEAGALIGADIYHQQEITGAGVSVAVIDEDFKAIDSVIGIGELPAGTFQLDFTGEGMGGNIGHGVAVAEQLMDIAPEISLHCCKVRDVLDLENAAKYVRNQGIPIVNMSLSWYGLSYYDDTGPFSTIVNESRENDGVFWVTSAGNAGNKHWRGLWRDDDGDGQLNFTADSERLKIGGSGKQVFIYLNWDQYGSRPRAMTDFDLYLLDDRNKVAAQSSDFQFLTGIPLELLSFTIEDTARSYSIAVVYASGDTAGVDLTIFTPASALEESVRAWSLADPANCRSAFATGAVNRILWDSTAPPPEPFSAFGPTTDGRMKPDIVGPDRTSSVSLGENGGAGTSLAAPVVAGAAALLLEFYPDFTADDLAGKLSSMAIDIGPEGPDSLSGAGKVFLDPDEIGATPAAHAVSRHRTQSKPTQRSTRLYDLRGRWVRTSPNVAPAHVRAPPAGIYVMRNRENAGIEYLLRYGTTTKRPIRSGVPSATGQ